MIRPSLKQRFIVLVIVTHSIHEGFRQGGQQSAGKQHTHRSAELRIGFALRGTIRCSLHVQDGKVRLVDDGGRLTQEGCSKLHKVALVTHPAGARVHRIVHLSASDHFRESLTASLIECFRSELVLLRCVDLSLDGKPNGVPTKHVSLACKPHRLIGYFIDNSLSTLVRSRAEIIRSGTIRASIETAHLLDDSHRGVLLNLIVELFGFGFACTQGDEILQVDFFHRTNDSHRLLNDHG